MRTRAGPGNRFCSCTGSCSTARQYEAQVAALRGQYRCLTLDFRGQGRSAASRGGYQAEQLTADVLAVIRALAIAPVHLAGLSMGGFAAMRIAARQPAVVRSLILLNTSAAAHPRGKVPGHLVLTAVGRLAGLSGRLLTSRIEAEMYGPAFRGDPGRAASGKRGPSDGRRRTARPWPRPCWGSCSGRTSATSSATSARPP